MKRVVNISIAAKLLGVHINTFRNWIKTHKLKVYRTPGGRFKIDYHELLKFIEKNDMPVPNELKYIDNSIFIIDDHQDIHTIYNKLLAGKNYTIFNYDNGFDALLAVPEKRPDLILLDIYLPEMNGLEFMKKLKEKKTFKTIKIIAMSNDINMKSDALASGADDFYYKSDNLQKLLKKIDKFV